MSRAVSLSIPCVCTRSKTGAARSAPEPTLCTCALSMTEEDGRPIDPGIRRHVEVLRANDVETTESCEGAPGHPFPRAGLRGRNRIVPPLPSRVVLILRRLMATTPLTEATP